MLRTIDTYLLKKRYVCLKLETRKFLKKKYTYNVPDFVRFQNRVILDFYGKSFHAMVAFFHYSFYKIDNS